MLDDGAMVGDAVGLAAADGYVAFVAAGTRAAGSYHCSTCRYGVTVHGPLPACPMCAGTTWEVAAWSPFSHASEPGSTRQVLPPARR
jgi:hypothetical protein